ncbi:hypothetical protein RHIZ_22810 [Rhizobium skierniewicense]|nr:hypothetical protein [Rhizobium skierniewicense]MCI9868789.1 hypothetical protein [Rhizobium skierniewicense]
MSKVKCPGPDLQAQLVLQALDLFLHRLDRSRGVAVVAEQDVISHVNVG